MGRLTRYPRDELSVNADLMGCVALAMPVNSVTNRHWPSQWHTAIQL